MSTVKDIWMLIVEKNKEFTEFGSTSFSKCSMKMLAIIGKIGEPIAASEVCS